MAFLCAFIHSTNILGPETSPGPGNTTVYVVDKASALRGGMGCRCQQIPPQHNSEGDIVWGEGGRKDHWK